MTHNEYVRYFAEKEAMRFQRQQYDAARGLNSMIPSLAQINRALGTPIHQEIPTPDLRVLLIGDDE